MTNIETQNEVALIEQGGEDYLICRTAGVRLNIGVACVEYLFGALAGEFFKLVGNLTAAVESLGRKTFGGLILQD